MSTAILRYPDGLTGVALLILRLSSGPVAFHALTPFPPRSWDEWAAAVSCALLALALAAGLCTRPAGVMLAAILAAELVIALADPWLLLAAAGTAAALALAGPGAYSLDAQRFGRRVIRLEPRSPDRGTQRSL